MSVTQLTTVTKTDLHTPPFIPPPNWAYDLFEKKAQMTKIKYGTIYFDSKHHQCVKMIAKYLPFGIGQTERESE